MIKDTINNVIKEYCWFPYNRDNIIIVKQADIQFVINDQMFFEILLCMISGNTISFSSYKKKTTSERELFLLRKIRRLEDRNCISDTAREELRTNVE